MTTVPLSALQQVDPREIWTHEERDFTPWLLEHADRLAEALGLDLELTAAEHPVGPFELDLLGRDLTRDAVLMVENQLGPTDHRHLGQLLTYAAGTDAATIVWIATRFADEHRQAIDWLNERTDETTHLFGIQLEVVRIDDSAPAPNLKVVAAPNDWQKRARRASRGDSAGSTGKAALYAAFWARLISRVSEERPRWSRRRALVGNPDNWSAFRRRYAALGLSWASADPLPFASATDCGARAKRVPVARAPRSRRPVSTP